MTGFDLPMTLEVGGRPHPVVLRCLRGPVSLGSALPALLALIGADPMTRMYVGLGAVEPDWICGAPPLLAHVRLLDRADTSTVTELGVFGLATAAGPDAGGWVNMPTPDAAGPGVITVGRDPSTDLPVADEQLSRRHLSVAVQSDHFLLTDLGSTNGTRVDGIAVTGPTRVRTGQWIEAGCSLFRLGVGAGATAMTEADGRGHWLVTRSARPEPGWAPVAPEPPGSEPERQRRALPWLAAGLGAVLGVGLALMTGIWTFLLLAALGPVTMIGTAIGDRIGGRRSHRVAVAAYRQTCAIHARALADLVDRDRDADWTQHPGPAEVVQRAVARRADLWPRRPGGAAWLHVRFGVGSRPLRAELPRPPLVDRVPVTVDLGRYPVLVLVDRSGRATTCLLAQLTVLHAPRDLQILLDGSAVAAWSSVPHTADRPGGDAEPDDGRIADSDTPGRHRVLVIDRTDPSARGDIWPALLERPLPPGLSVICIVTDPRRLPPTCTAVVDAGDGPGGLVVTTAGSSAPVSGTTDGLGPADAARVRAALGPLLDRADPAADLPGTVDLAELNGLPVDRLDGVIHTAETIDPGRPPSIPAMVAALRTRWQHPCTAALLGRSGQGVVSVDLVADGPHFLIAGTTGSGKSELLRSLVAGLAVAAPPERITFLLVDYKGGAAFAEAAGLPHTVGMVTDLDPDLATRALTSLRAELSRRERLLLAANHTDLADWAAAPTATVQGRCPARLVIVVDEFATLAADLPEFLQGLLDVAQRGRSLGVHLVLATQRPAGVVSPAMKANIAGRICLRVTDDGDSTDVIDRPDAATLPAGLPGRAYLRTGRRQVTLFQTARVSGPAAGAPRGFQVRRRGEPPAPPPATGSATLLQELVAACRDAADRDTAGAHHPERPWLPALPAPLSRSAAQGDPWARPGAVELLGLRDLPAQQSRSTLVLPAGGLLVVGGPGSGRSGALRSAAAAVAPGCGLVVVDCSRGLTDLADDPRCSTYLDGREPPLVLRLLELLRARLDAPGAPVLVLIDTWEALLGALEPDSHPAASALAELAARGPVTGLRLVVAGSPRLVHTAVAGQFGTVLELRSDTPVPGEGTIARDRVRILHTPAGTSFPEAGAVARAATVTGAAAVAGPRTSAGTGPGGSVVVRSLPVRVPATAGQVAAGLILLGAAGDAAAPTGFDPTGPGGAFVIAGPRRSGVSSAIALVAGQAATLGIPVIQLTRTHDPAALVQRLAIHDGPLMITADNAHDLQDSALSTVLERFLDHAGTGQYLVVGGRSDRFARTFRGLVTEACGHRHGVLLQPSPTDGALFDVRLPRLPSPIRPGRGYLVAGGEAVPIQLAHRALPG